MNITRRENANEILNEHNMLATRLIMILIRDVVEYFRILFDQRPIIFTVLDDVSPILIGSQSVGVTDDYHQAFCSS